jgi:DNA ligase D-like protein (predicted 3'-phosphoesterase)
MGSSKKHRLETYASRRSFRKTPEPDVAEDSPVRWRKDDNPIFVVQKHDASSLHYDFRLEVDGTLRSWAVPKGPSTDPSERRLAVQTEDHPLSYADFEGVIPEGEYGAGTVLVWDAGPYRVLEDEDGNRPDPSEKLDEGHLDVWLEGKKIRGGYSLIHARLGGKDENWLLVKQDDEGADARRNPTSTEPRSVLSGRTIAEIRDEEGDDGGRAST